MTRLARLLDPYFVLLLFALFVWFLIAGALKTSATEIRRLDRTNDPGTWVQALWNPDRTVRTYAREHIVDRVPAGELGPPSMTAAESNDPGEQMAGLWLLSKVEIVGRGALAARYLNAPTPEMKALALDILAEDPSPETRSALLEMAQSEDASIQASAITALASLANPLDLGFFLDSLGRSDPTAHQAARNGITEIARNDPSVIGRLFDVLAGPDMSAGREAAELIGGIGGPENLDGLFYYLEFGNAALSPEVAGAIARIDGESARSRALDMYRNGTPRARRGAVRVIGALKITEAANDLLSTALNQSEEFWLRLYSMETLAECGSESQVPQILRFLDQQEEDARLIRAAIEALGGMDGPQVLDVYDRILNGEEDFGLAGEGADLAKISVAAGLGHMDTGESRTRLRDLLKNASLQDTELTIQVIRSMGNVGVPDDIPLLKEAKVGRLMLVSPVDDAVKSIQIRYQGR